MPEKTHWLVQIGRTLASQLTEHRRKDDEPAGGSDQ